MKFEANIFLRELKSLMNFLNFLRINALIKKVSKTTLKKSLKLIKKFKLIYMREKNFADVFFSFSS